MSIKRLAAGFEVMGRVILRLIARLPFVKVIDQLCKNRLLGSPWHAEPGSVELYQLYDFWRERQYLGLPIGHYVLFHYTHWRERSLFAGKSYSRRS